MSLQQRLQADIALLKVNATEAKGIQELWSIQWREKRGGMFKKLKMRGLELW